jgi:hypothetical protein
VKKPVSPDNIFPLSLSLCNLRSPPAFFLKARRSAITYIYYAETGSVEVSSLILFEREEIVLYSGIHITVDLEVVLCTIRSIVRNCGMHKSELVYVSLPQIFDLTKFAC